MAEKQDMSHKYNEGENLELDNPVYYLESSHPAPPYTEAPPYPNASNSGAPYTGAPYTGAPYTGATYTGAPYTNAPYTFTPQAEAPHAGAPFSQYTSAAVIVEQPRPTTTTIVTETQSYMGLAVFACLCCFWPLGLVAISRANESQNSLARGDFVGAAAKGREARTFSLVSILLGIVCIVIIVVIRVALV